MKTIDVSADVRRLRNPRPATKRRAVRAVPLPPRAPDAPNPADATQPELPVRADAESAPPAIDSARGADAAHAVAAALTSAVFLARLGGIVLALRKSATLTQDQLAERAGVNVATVQRIEHGSHEPTVGTLRAIERGLGVKPGLLMKMAK